MWENAAQSLNWWQYAGRVWRDANSAQPHNSHLAPRGGGLGGGNLDVPMPVHGSIHHDQPTPPPMVDCALCDDWRAMISIIRLDAGIDQPLPSPTAHLDRPLLWYMENRDSSMKIQCLHCLRSHTLCLLPNSRWRRLCSKVSLGHLAGYRN